MKAGREAQFAGSRVVAAARDRCVRSAGRVAEAAENARVGTGSIVLVAARNRRKRTRGADRV